MTDTPTERVGESAWTTLRNRKVVQWGLLYLAAAWGFLQGVEYLSGTYDWPRQIQQLATLVALIGLPVVLVIGWYHGDRGQQRVTTSELVIPHAGAAARRRCPLVLPACERDLDGCVFTHTDHRILRDRCVDCRTALRQSVERPRQ